MTAPERTPAAAARRCVVVIGVGNYLRHDDAAGLATVRLLRARAHAAEIEVYELEGEMLALLDLWAGADAVVLVDAIHCDGPPGSISRLDATSAAIPASLRGSASTHAVGVGEAIELARALQRLPGRVVLFGVKGRCFDAGFGLSEEVADTTGRLADAVLREAIELTNGQAESANLA